MVRGKQEVFTAASPAGSGQSGKDQVISLLMNGEMKAEQGWSWKLPVCARLCPKPSQPCQPIPCRAWSLLAAPALARCVQGEILPCFPNILSCSRVCLHQCPPLELGTLMFSHGNEQHNLQRNISFGMLICCLSPSPSLYLSLYVRRGKQRDSLGWCLCCRRSGGCLGYPRTGGRAGCPSWGSLKRREPRLIPGELRAASRPRAAPAPGSIQEPHPKPSASTSRAPRLPQHPNTCFAICICSAQRRKPRTFLFMFYFSC